MCTERTWGSGTVTVLQSCCARQKGSNRWDSAVDRTLVSNLKMQTCNGMTWQAALVKRVQSAAGLSALSWEELLKIDRELFVCCVWFRN